MMNERGRDGERARWRGGFFYKERQRERDIVRMYLVRWREDEVVRWREGERAGGREVLRARGQGVERS